MLLLERESTSTPKVLELSRRKRLSPLQEVEMLWEETRTLTRIMKNWDETTVFPTFLPLVTPLVVSPNNKALLDFGNRLIREVGDFRIDFDRSKDIFATLLREQTEQHPDLKPHEIVRDVLDIVTEYAASTDCNTTVKELSPGIQNPLKNLGSQRSHNLDTLLTNDSIYRALPSMWSAWYPPNCLGFSIFLTAVLHTMDYRFLHCSTLTSALSEERSLESLAVRNAISFLQKVEAPPKKISALKQYLAGREGLNVIDWMYHHFSLVEYSQEHAMWMIIDPYIGCTTDLGHRPDLSALKTQLDIRKDALPGLAVPIQLSSGGDVRRKRMHRANARARTLFGSLYMKYAELKRTKGGYLTEREFREEIAHLPILKTYNWAAKKLRDDESRNAEQSAKLLETISREQRDSFQHLFQDIPESEFVDEAILQIINYGWLVAKDRIVCQAERAGHRMVEVHANYVHALGLFIKQAAYAETNFTVFPHELLQESSSQLIWREIGDRVPQSEARVPVLAALKAASSFFGKELDEDLLHPLVLRECRRQSLR